MLKAMLDKAIKQGKEHRKPFRGAKRFDRSCRNHGGCPYCRDGRTAKDSAKRDFAENEIREFHQYNFTDETWQPISEN